MKLEGPPALHPCTAAGLPLSEKTFLERSDMQLSEHDYSKKRFTSKEGDKYLPEKIFLSRNNKLLAASVR